MGWVNRVRWVVVVVFVAMSEVFHSPLYVCVLPLGVEVGLAVRWPRPFWVFVDRCTKALGVCLNLAQGVVYMKMLCWGIIKAGQLIALTVNMDAVDVEHELEAQEVFKKVS